MTQALEKQTLLVVDPSNESLPTILHDARIQGFSVITADGVTGAMALFDHALPELVLTDLYYPSLDGLALIQHVRERQPTCPIITMSTLSNDSPLITVLKACTHGYLRKPLDSRQLKDTLLHAVQGIPPRLNVLPGIERVEYLLVLNNDPSNIEAAVTALLSLFHGSLPDPHLMHLRATLHELILNAVEHGSLEITFQAKHAALARDGYENLIALRRRQGRLMSRRVTIRAVHDRVHHCLEFRIGDQGKGFKWRSSLRKGHNLSQYSHGSGRGISLASTFFPSLTYNKKGNEARFTVPLSHGHLATPLH